MAKPARAVAGFSICAMLAATTAFGQARFQATDATAIAGLSGLRIVSLRDTLRNRCYLAFIADAPTGADIVQAGPADVAAAAAQRDHDLAQLVHAYESDTSVYAGTIQPNPLKYEVLAQTAQINFLVTAIESLLARLDAQIDRATVTSSAALAVMPDACATSDTRTTPP